MSVSSAHSRRSTWVPCVKTSAEKAASVGWRTGSEGESVAVRSSIS